jgi:hypothetical protein
MTTLSHEKRRDLDADATIEITALEGFRLIESDGFLDVDTQLTDGRACPMGAAQSPAVPGPRAWTVGGVDSQLAADATVEIGPRAHVEFGVFDPSPAAATLRAAARRLTPAAPRHVDSLSCEWPAGLAVAPRSGSTAYADACRRVLAPFPPVRSRSLVQRTRARLSALALAAWCGPGVAVVRGVVTAAFGAAEWLRATRRRLAPSVHGVLGRAGGVGRRVRGLARTCRGHIERAGTRHRASAGRLLAAMRARALRRRGPSAHGAEL